VEIYSKIFFSQNWWLLKTLKRQKLEKANFAHFVSCPLDNLLKDIFSQNWRLLKTLKRQKVEKANFAYFKVARLVKIYSNTSFHKIGGF